ncbi:MAG TPA: NAD(P)H-dependent oxidoreductase subunit E, partial [Acetobacteraceae bacterium]|nr:NAD(P)H-dependent oxidoreductase subunit E [Acetobacteraceae bacterium]
MDAECSRRHEPAIEIRAGYRSPAVEDRRHRIPPFLVCSATMQSRTYFYSIMNGILSSRQSAGRDRIGPGAARSGCGGAPGESGRESRAKACIRPRADPRLASWEHHMQDERGWSRERIAAIVLEKQGMEGPALPVLRAVQEEYGHVPREAVPVIAEALNITRAELHGVLSFYH